MPETGESVVILLRDFSGGGAERSMINIANGLAAIGVNVDLVLFRRIGEFEMYVSDKVNCIELNVRAVGIGVVTAVLPLANYLRESRPSFIISSLEATTIVTAFALKLLANPPELLIRVATTFGEEKRPFLRDFLIRRVYLNHKGMFVANSNGSKENLVKVLGIKKENIRVIYNAVDIDRISEWSKESSAVLNYIDDRTPYVVNVGRLTYAKRQDVLIRAFATLAAEFDLDLVILGEGPMRSELESLIRGLGLEARVHMPGFISNPYSCISNALVFVLSSDYEGMPTVLLEALATGCPVVSTDCPSGPDEILEKGKWGKLVDVGNPEELAEAIAGVIRSPPNRERLKVRASAFSIEKMAFQYHRLILER